MELMVVVVLVGILTMIATPAMSAARDDRMAFDYARRVEQMIGRARSRSAGRGAAHLFIAAPSGASRGRFLLFEALDGTAGPTGPNPVSSCKGAGQWAAVTNAWAAGTVSNTANIIEGLDLNSTGANVSMDLRTAFSVNGTGATAVAICVTPGGSTFVGQGADIVSAITSMQTQTVPFSSFLQITITRNVGGTPIGLTRNVIMAGGAAPRIRS
jgi:type II secretory pathway pseudopilin PulG